jgi:transposase InsO family protein
MYDTLHYGRPFPTLNVIDESNREILAIKIDISLPAARVVRTLEQLEEIHGLPKSIRLDNGSELRSAVFMGWCESKVLNSNLSSLVNPHKTPLLNALIKPTATKYSMPIYLKTSGRYAKSPNTGSRFTTKKDRIVP